MIRNGRRMFRVILTMCIGGLWAAGCSTPGQDITPVLQRTPSAERRPMGTPSPGAEERPVRLERTVIRTRQGQRWELEAEEVDWMDNRSQAKAHDVTWYLLGPQGERTVRVDSPGADLDMEAELVTFVGQVVARRLDSEESLEVNHLIYRGKERRFYGSEGVLWKRQGVTLAGQALTATAELDKVQLKGRVRGRTEGGLLKLEDFAAPSGQQTP